MKEDPNVVRSQANRFLSVNRFGTESRIKMKCQALSYKFEKNNQFLGTTPSLRSTYGIHYIEQPILSYAAR